MLMDNAKVTFKGGDGGNGKVSFKKIGRGPDGGNGGKGGDLYVRASSDLTLLNKFSQKTFFSAEDGQPGERNTRYGRKGQDLYIELPVGSEIVELGTKKILASLETVGETILLSKGGRGGMGNYEFRSARNTTPKYAQSGEKATELNLEISLKLIADYGLIGLPNSGKSSLLNELTGANAKTGNFSFTTLSPNLGVLNGKVIADIPGLIEGASEGRGLGIKFLKHIEKVKVLLHCIDSTTQDFEKDYQTVRSELEKYNPTLLDKKEVILLTKSDLIDSKSNKIKFKKAILVSIHDQDAIDRIKKIIV